MENLRNPPLGHDIIEISDDEEDEDSVIDLGTRQRQASPLIEDAYPPAYDRGFDGDDHMLGYRLHNHDEPQRGFLPPILRQPDPALLARPLVRIPNFDPFADPALLPDRQQGLKRQRRDERSPDNPPSKRPIVIDSPPQQRRSPLADAPQPGFLGLGQDRPMFEANLRDGHNGLVPGVNGLRPAAAFPNRAVPRVVESFSEEACLFGVRALFPDISPDYVSNLWQTKPKRRTVEGLVNWILQEGDEGRPYTKVFKEVPAAKLKKKHSLEQESKEETKYLARNRSAEGFEYHKECKQILSFEFPWVPMKTIDNQLALAADFLFPAYMALYELERQWAPDQQTYAKLKKPRVAHAAPMLAPANIELAVNGSLPTSPILVSLLKELKVARAAKMRLKAKEDMESRSEKQERENEEQSRALGAMDECSCCFSEYPLNRMVHCSNEGSLHSFCKTCVKTNAETEVGQGKYLLVCMSMDGCPAGFSRDQRDLFLDDKLKIALERIEMEHNLRMAGIENLESCPFCPFAAEYPPVEEDRVFRCLHPDCGVESCRLCKKVSHIPKTCDEFARESGADAQRRRLEDAMSEALVKKCNKCKTPFIKSDGCNKITCTKCRNVQCYICSEDCVAGPNGGSYAHFNDPSRGGKAGQCPLFDDTEQRHQEVVEAAQKAAIANIQAEFPGYTEEELKVKETAAAKEDREARARNNPMGRYPGMMGPYGFYGMPLARPDEQNMRVMLGRVREGQAMRVLAEPALAEDRNFHQINRELEAELDRLMAAHRAVEVRRDELVAAAPVPGAAAPREDRGNAHMDLDYQDAMNYMLRPHQPRYPEILVISGGLDPPPAGGNNVLGPRPKPPAPPPQFDPAKVVENERKVAQDRAMRDAYQRAPLEVQARRRDQMRRMMRDPNLDDAAVERAILRGGGEAANMEEGAVPPGAEEREQEQGILDRLQGRREVPPPRGRPENVSSPSPQREVVPHPAIGDLPFIQIDPAPVSEACAVPQRQAPGRQALAQRQVPLGDARHGMAGVMPMNMVPLAFQVGPRPKLAPLREAAPDPLENGGRGARRFASVRRRLRGLHRRDDDRPIAHPRPADEASAREVPVLQPNDDDPVLDNPFEEAVSLLGQRRRERDEPVNVLRWMQLDRADPMLQEPVVNPPVKAAKFGRHMPPAPPIPQEDHIAPAPVPDQAPQPQLEGPNFDRAPYPAWRPMAPGEPQDNGRQRREQLRELEGEMMDLEIQCMMAIRVYNARLRPGGEPVPERLRGLLYDGNFDEDDGFDDPFALHDMPLRPLPRLNRPARHPLAPRGGWLPEPHSLLDEIEERMAVFRGRIDRINRVPELAQEGAETAHGREYFAVLNPGPLAPRGPNEDRHRARLAARLGLEPEQLVANNGPAIVGRGAVARAVMRFEPPERVHAPKNVLDPSTERPAPAIIRDELEGPQRLVVRLRDSRREDALGPERVLAGLVVAALEAPDRPGNAPVGDVPGRLGAGGGLIPGPRRPERLSIFGAPRRPIGQLRPAPAARAGSPARASVANGEEDLIDLRSPSGGPRSAIRGGHPPAFGGSPADRRMSGLGASPNREASRPPRRLPSFFPGMARLVSDAQRANADESGVGNYGIGRPARRGSLSDRNGEAIGVRPRQRRFQASPAGSNDARPGSPPPPPSPPLQLPRPRPLQRAGSAAGSNDAVAGSPLPPLLPLLPGAFDGFGERREPAQRERFFFHRYGREEAPPAFPPLREEAAPPRRSRRPLQRQAAVLYELSDEDSDHDGGDLGIPASPLERLNLEMRRASIADGEEEGERV